jgi:threonine/homoserine/homoserine lactone efflux protein
VRRFRLSIRSHTEIVRNVGEGFITNVLNPSIAAFYFIIVPQFVPRGTPAARGVLTLTAVHVALAATWHVVWAMAGGALARTLSAGAPRRALDLAAGLALVALAIKLASS